jgi:hypothetical protein
MIAQINSQMATAGEPALVFEIAELFCGIIQVDQVKVDSLLFYF